MIGFDVPPDKTNIKNNGHTGKIFMIYKIKNQIMSIYLYGG